MPFKEWVAAVYFTEDAFAVWDSGGPSGKASQLFGITQPPVGRLLAPDDALLSVVAARATKTQTR